MIQNKHRNGKSNTSCIFVQCTPTRHSSTEWAKWLPDCSRRVSKMRLLLSGYYVPMFSRRKFRVTKTSKVPTRVALLPNSYSVPISRDKSALYGGSGRQMTKKILKLCYSFKSFASIVA